MKRLLSVLMVLMPAMANGADATSFSVAMANVRANCGGISNELSHLKTMAGINTAVSATGTVAGGVALGTGIAKTKVDQEIQDIKAKLAERASKPSTIEKPIPTNVDLEKLRAELLSADYDVSSTTATDDLTAAQAAAEKKSKTLGDVRTGTLAASTATSIAGAVISGTNKIDEDLSAKIGACSGAISALSNALGQARIDGSATSEEVARADKIISACGQYDVVDITAINKRATGGMISSTIGAATGLTGTITSGVANSDDVRHSGTDKEKKLNTASNVLAGATTAAAATATIFNATQISAIKKMSTIADECEGAIQ